MNPSTSIQRNSISRRQLAQGAAWATPIIAASTVIPAYAASPGKCVASVGVSSGASYDFGDTTGTGTTTQSLWFAGSGRVSGLPADAVITSATLDLVMPNRNDAVNNGAGPGAYDPGNSHVGNLPAGVTCSTSYATISGCDFTRSYNPARLGNAYSASSGTGTRTMLYNGGGQTTGAMWDPSISKATVRLVSNWTPYTFQTGIRARAWTLRYTADATIAQSLLTKDANGCLGFSTSTSKDTPLFNIIYNNVTKAIDPALRDFSPEAVFTVTYTSGGQSYTVQVKRTLAF